MSVSEEIKVVKGHIEELRDELAKAEKTLYHLQLEAADIQIGMLVEDKQGKVYRVTRAEYFDNYGNAQPWLYGNLRKKDGTFGAHRAIYRDWKKLAGAGPCAAGEPQA